MTNLINDLLLMDITNQIFSVVKGNVNWRIRTQKNPNGHRVAYVGKAHIMEKRGFSVNTLQNISKYHMRWFNYTYKKDFIRMIDVLKTLEYSIVWIE